MKGEDVKKILRANGVTHKMLADRFGTSIQNIGSLLSKEDVRTGLLEDIVRVTDIPMSAFYPELCGVMNYSQNSDSPIVPESVIQLLAKKDEQIDRLLAVIEKLSVR